MGQVVVEQLSSADGKRRARIVQRAADGLFSVELERLVPGEGPYEPREYWSPVRQSVTIADTLERARALAKESLGLL
jgi:hypothetical protein